MMSHFDCEWGISGKIIYDTSKNIFLIFTGSSAVELEINGDIARRINKESIYPLNFKEYLLLKHNIWVKSEFSKSLMKMIVSGEKKDIEKCIESEKEIHSKLLDLKNDTEIEFLNFLKTYGFPFTLTSKAEEAYKKIYTIIESSIEKDIPVVKTFNFDTYNNIRRILIYIALQKPEGTSSGQLANYLSISSSTVREILDALEKTQILFSIKPYGESSKIIKKPWVYYFLSPSIKTAINSEMGRYDFNNPHFLARLAENLVAITLYKMIKTEFRLIGLFYPPNKGSSDFILRTNFDNLVPIEVGLG
ncbi:MAG: ATP-binding protein, partial [Methanobrevibacter sp.]|nr:ATP-binding protein [Candidatus Methanoflexus mossambicus]